MDYSLILVATCVAFCASLLAIKLIKPIAFRVGLVDSPNARKVHKGDIPLIGGISVFIGVLTAFTIISTNSQVLNLYLIASALIVFLGVLDDYKELPVAPRVCAQVLISAIMVYGADIHLLSLGNIFQLGEIELGWLGYPLTVIAVIACINAFNMSDGIDGLAGSLSLISFAGLAVLMQLKPGDFAVLPFILSFAMLPYLVFNLGLVGSQAKKIFMGDAGSMFVGLSVVWLLVEGSQGSEQAFRPVTALWIIAVPFWDMCAITIRRISQGRSPFKPDREHLHHIFLHLGYTSNQALLRIAFMSLCLLAFGVWGELAGIPESMMFVLYLVGFAAYYYALKHIWKLSRLIKMKRALNKRRAEEKQ